MGFGEDKIEEVVGDEIALNRIKDLVTSGVTVAESQSKFEYEQIYGKLNASVVHLRASDFAKEVKVTDEDIAKYYDSQKATLTTDEKRKVEFVSLALTDEQKKLSGKERIDVFFKSSPIARTNSPRRFRRKALNFTRSRRAFNCL